MGRKQYFKLKNSFSSGTWAVPENFVGGGQGQKKAFLPPPPPPIKTKKTHTREKVAKSPPYVEKGPP